MSSGGRVSWRIQVRKSWIMLYSAAPWPPCVASAGASVTFSVIGISIMLRRCGTEASQALVCNGLTGGREVSRTSSVP